MGKLNKALASIGLTCLVIVVITHFDAAVYTQSLVHRVGYKYFNRSVKTDAIHRVSSNKSVILIISYMRSGTSFLGKIFDESNDTLYVFEPLYTACEFIFPAYEPLKFVSGETRLPNTSCEMYGLEIIKAYLSCELGRIDAGTLGSIWIGKGKLTARYCACFQGSNLLGNCLNRFVEVCQKSTKVVLKFIRIRLSYVLPLLQGFPQLKVIHLVRDPRGIIQSRFSMGEFYHRNVMATGVKICGNMLRDIKAYNSYNGFRERVVQVRYEDIAEHPLKMATQIYKWVGEKMPETVIKWINANTGAEADSRGHLGTSRANSTYAATHWRDKISWDLAWAIDRRCSEVLNSLGYVKLSRMEILRNWTIPLRQLPRDRQLGSTKYKHNE